MSGLILALDSLRDALGGGDNARPSSVAGPAELVREGLTRARAKLRDAELDGKSLRAVRDQRNMGRLGLFTSTTGGEREVAGSCVTADVTRGLFTMRIESWGPDPEEWDEDERGLPIPKRHASLTGRMLEQELVEIDGVRIGRTEYDPRDEAALATICELAVTVRGLQQNYLAELAEMEIGTPAQPDIPGLVRRIESGFNTAVTASGTVPAQAPSPDSTGGVRGA